MTRFILAPQQFRHGGVVPTRRREGAGALPYEAKDDWCFRRGDPQWSPVVLLARWWLQYGRGAGSPGTGVPNKPQGCGGVPDGLRPRGGKGSRRATERSGGLCLRKAYLKPLPVFEVEQSTPDALPDHNAESVIAELEYGGDAEVEGRRARAPLGNAAADDLEPTARLAQAS